MKEWATGRVSRALNCCCSHCQFIQIQQDHHHFVSLGTSESTAILCSIRFFAVISNDESCIIQEALPPPPVMLHLLFPRLLSCFKFSMKFGAWFWAAGTHKQKSFSDTEQVTFLFFHFIPPLFFMLFKWCLFILIYIGLISPAAT